MLIRAPPTERLLCPEHHAARRAFHPPHLQSASTPREAATVTVIAETRDPKLRTRGVPGDTGNELSFWI